ncbi:MAG: DNA primase, partial [Desulfovibrio sp.]|nr:DNA primase [Desulfovibrio sp.]
MQFSEAKQAIKARLSIVTLVSRYLTLTRNGSRWVAPCPFHQETKPSFTVNEELGTFYCFGCQAKGDIFGFYSQINGVDFKQALSDLAKETGITLEGGSSRAQRAKEREERRRKLAMQEVSTYTARLFSEALANSAANSAPKLYLAKRGLSSAIIERFGLGWAHQSWDALSNALQSTGQDLNAALEAGLIGQGRHGKYYDRFRGRLMFPITTFPKQVIAFGGRIIAEVDEPKYINSSETPIYHKGEHLYGLVQAAPEIRAKKYALLTEGYMDVLTLHQFGYGNAVGVLGTALTTEQIHRLTSGFTSNLTLLFDGDAAGRKAALRACQMIVPLGLRCQVVLLPEPEDIDSLLRKPKGPELFADLLAKSTDGLDYFASCLEKEAPREMIAKIHSFLQKITVPELFSPMARRLAQVLGLSEQEVRQGQAKIRAKERNAPRAAAFLPPPRQEVLSIPEREVLMFAVRYPEHLEWLRDLGAEHVLKSAKARELWLKLQDPEHLAELLSPEEKAQVEAWRGKNAPPLLENHEQELAAMRTALEQ